MTKSVFSKLCNKHGGYVSTTGEGYDIYVVHDASKRGGDLESFTGGGIGDLDMTLEFFGGRISPQTYVGGGKKSNKSTDDMDSFMAYLQGKGDALVAGDIAGAKAFLSGHKDDRPEEDDEE